MLLLDHREYPGIMIKYARLTMGELIMRCAIISRAGQVLANGRLILHKSDDGELRLDLETDGGRLFHGGIIDSDGDMTSASDGLFRQFLEVWGMSDLTLTVTSQGKLNTNSGA